jgi:hypothetical protein
VTVTATRVSTIASSLDDKGGLSQYLQAVAVWTIGSHEDLRDQLALILSNEPKHWKAFQPLIREADKRRGTPEANQGTNRHEAIAALVEGRDVSFLNSQVVRDAEAAMKAAADLGVELMHPEDFLVVEGLPELAAGSRDWLGRLPDGTVQVVDIKTADALGKESYKGVSWAAQTAMYARGKPYRAPFTRDRWGRPQLDLALTYDEPRVIDQATSVVIEIERGTARTQVHRLDIALGWELAELACHVRRARKVDVFLPV